MLPCPYQLVPSSAWCCSCTGALRQPTCRPIVQRLTEGTPLGYRTVAAAACATHRVRQSPFVSHQQSFFPGKTLLRQCHHIPRIPAPGRSLKVQAMMACQVLPAMSRHYYPFAARCCRMWLCLCATHDALQLQRLQAHEIRAMDAETAPGSTCRWWTNCARAPGGRTWCSAANAQQMSSHGGSMSAAIMARRPLDATTMACPADAACKKGGIICECTKQAYCQQESLSKAHVPDMGLQSRNSVLVAQPCTWLDLKVAGFGLGFRASDLS